MTLVNTTFAVDEPLVASLVSWLKEAWIPEARRSGGRSFSLGRVVGAESPTLALQMRLRSREAATEWLDSLMQPLLRDMAARWATRVLAFTTLLDIIPLDD